MRIKKLSEQKKRKFIFYIDSFHGLIHAQNLNGRYAVEIDFLDIKFIDITTKVFPIKIKVQYAVISKCSFCTTSLFGYRKI